MRLRYASRRCSPTADGSAPTSRSARVWSGPPIAPSRSARPRSRCSPTTRPRGTAVRRSRPSSPPSANVSWPPTSGRSSSMPRTSSISPGPSLSSMRAPSRCWRTSCAWRRRGARRTSTSTSAPIARPAWRPASRTSRRGSGPPSTTAAGDAQGVIVVLENGSGVGFGDGHLDRGARPHRRRAGRRGHRARAVRLLPRRRAPVGGRLRDRRCGRGGRGAWTSSTPGSGSGGSRWST